MTAIFPTVNHEPIRLRQASAGGTLDEPQSTTIATGRNTESVGFGGAPVNVQVKLLADSDSDDPVAIEICDEPTFAVASLHPDSPIDISSLVANKIVQIGLQGAPGYWRLNNTSSIGIQVSIFRLPNRR